MVELTGMRKIGGDAMTQMLEMPRVQTCTVTSCGYNHDGCTAFAVTIGSAISAECDTYVEYGDKGVSLKNLYRLKQVLGVSADYILEGDETYISADEKKKRLSENIMGSLSVCSVQQLNCMEQIARLYVEGIVNKE